VKKFDELHEDETLDSHCLQASHGAMKSCRLLLLVEVIGSLSVGSGAMVEEGCTAAAGVAAGLAWVDLELGLEVGGLAVGFAVLDSGGG